MNTIYIYNVIDPFWGVSAEGIAAALEAAAGKPVDVRINSNGGLIDEGVAIHNLLKSYKGKVRVIIDGIAASIASVIAMGGHEIIMGDGAMLFTHMPLCGVMGNAEQLRKEADNLDKYKETILDIYEKRTGMAREAILSLMQAETYITAKEAVEMKFADSIGVPVDGAAIVNRMSFLKTVTNAAPVAAACKEAGIEFSAQAIADIAKRLNEADAKVAAAEQTAESFVAQATADVDAAKAALAKAEADLKAAQDAHAAALAAKDTEVEARASAIAAEKVAGIGFKGTPPSAAKPSANGVEDIESLRAEINSETDPRKKGNLAKRIAALRAASKR